MGYPMQELTNDNRRVYDLPVEIIIKETYWVCCPDTGTGGRPIDLFPRIMGMNFSEAQIISEDTGKRPVHPAKSLNYEFGDPFPFSPPSQ